MARKTRNGGRAVVARFKHEKFHYMEAYRARIKELRNWTAGQIASTLHWMWRYKVTEAERAECERLFAAASTELMDTNDRNIPDEFKRSSDPAPPADAPEPEPEAEQEVDPEADPVGEPVAELNIPDQLLETEPVSNAPAAVTTVASNTTAFSFWPAAEASTALPHIYDVDAAMVNEGKRDLFAAGFHYGPEEANEKRWKAVHILGTGSSAVASLWVRQNETNYIEMNMAVRDVAPIDRERWTSPFFWRDRLPREIAIQERLKEQAGHDHNIHRYYGNRVDMSQRRYRVYNEVCQFGDLYTALGTYSTMWTERRNMCRWLEVHPEIKQARKDAEEGVLSGRLARDKADAMIQQKKDEANEEYKQAKEQSANTTLEGETAEERAARQLRTSTEFDDMSESALLKLGNEPDHELPEVIPESFLWHVFEQLVDVLTLLHQDNGQEIEGKPWREIVHRDIHTLNIFVKPKKGQAIYDDGNVLTFNEDGKNFETLKIDKNLKETRVFKPKQYPNMVLADFDFAFFDLQSSPSEYQDNPHHYILSSKPNKGKARGSRYPLELYHNYYNEHTSPNQKITSKTDIFGLGQVMWNLIMNIPGKEIDLQEPFFDNAGTQGDLLVNGGKPYTNDDLSAGTGRFLSGQTPYEASSMYNDELKDLVRSCLRYLPAEWPTVAELKALIKTHREDGVERRTRTRNLLKLIMPEMKDRFEVGQGVVEHGNGSGEGGEKSRQENREEE